MNTRRVFAVIVFALAAVVAIAALVAVVVALVGDTTSKSPTPPQVTVKVNEGKGDGQPTKTVKVPAAVVKQTAPKLESALKDETPPLAEQVTPGELTAAQEAAANIRATQPPLPTAGASAGFIGCRTQFVQNQSSRHGTRPQLQVLHYTVSHNLLGWADVNAVVALFDRSSSQASSNFVIDAEGNCAYIVPIEAKAWTQAAANPYSVSYEVIDWGNESVYLQPAGYAKLRSVMAQVSARTGIPMRQAIVNGCVPVRSGITDHASFGYCGGGHHDIGPFPVARVIGTLTASQPVTKQVKWLNHRKAITRTYQSKCKHAYQRQRRPVTCAGLRADARKLDRLLSRRTT